MALNKLVTPAKIMLSIVIVLFGYLLLEVSIFRSLGYEEQLLTDYRVLLWIIFCTLAFLMGLLIVKSQYSKKLFLINPDEQTSHDSELAAIVRAAPLVFVFTILGIIDLIIYYALSFSSGGGISASLLQRQVSGGLWRIQHVVGLNVWKGFFLPVYAAPAIFSFSVMARVVIGRNNKNEGLSLSKKGKRYSRLLTYSIIGSFLTCIFFSLLILDRLTLAVTFFSTVIMLVIVLSKGKIYRRDFFRRKKVILLVVVLIIIAVAFMNSQSRLDKGSSLRSVTFDYFSTETIGVYHVLHNTSAYSYGATLFSWVWESLGITPPRSAQISTQGPGASISSNQASNIWMIAWMDFGILGLYLLFIFGIIAEILYLKANRGNSLFMAYLYSLIATTIIVSPHVFLPILITFWWNIVMFYICYRFRKRKVEIDDSIWLIDPI